MARRERFERRLRAVGDRPVRSYAGEEIEISLTYASDDTVALPGVSVDEIETPGGDGSTSFEDDGNPMDGWTVPGAPAGSEPNPNDWIVGTAEDSPEPLGATIDASLAQEPEVIAFESSTLGRYPFSAAGGIVDIAPIGFTLENTDPAHLLDRLLHGRSVGWTRRGGRKLAHRWLSNYLTVTS